MKKFEGRIAQRDWKKQTKKSQERLRQERTCQALLTHIFYRYGKGSQIFVKQPYFLNVKPFLANFGGFERIYLFVCLYIYIRVYDFQLHWPLGLWYRY